MTDDTVTVEPDDAGTSDIGEPGAKNPYGERVDHVELGGDESLGLSQADRLATIHGAKVVLIAGEFQSGKTTLVAELYGGFLAGPYCDWCFAGSDSLYALDRRYHTTREKAKLEQPDMPRTEEEEMRLIDLRLRRGGRGMPLMFSDIRGEFFDNISQGGRVEEEVPLARRSDAVVLLVDGEKINDHYQRAETVNLARLLIGGLTEPQGIPAETPLAIVLSKVDVVDEAGIEWFETRAERLRDFAARRGCGPVEVFWVAARPAASPHAPQGLELLFEWLCEDTARMAELPSVEAGDGGRSFWRWTT